ncbi:hypothetical protein SUGI_0717080 [Cryptomeria japonica]|nr:hypothetical protein SUGI_0717080 [Cryptomeria japonica]
MEMAMKCFILAVTMMIAVNICSSLALGGGDSLLLGESLAGKRSIISNNGMFELGFFSPRGTSNWYIGIWYARISPKVIVWVANRDNPIRSMLGVLKFSSDGRLRLLDGKGWSVWSTDLAVKGSRATITNSGNFIMLGHGQNNSEIVWESFAHPTDTWLPGMKLWKGMKLTSWKSSVDPASGLFSLGMDMSPGKTQMLMLYNNIVPYWSSGEWTGNYFANVPEVHGRRTKVNAVSMISAGQMDCAMQMMCVVVLRVSSPSATLKVGGQVGVLGEGPCNARSQRGPPTASWNPRTETCPKKKLSHTTSQQCKAAELLASIIAPAQPLLSISLIYQSVDSGLGIYSKCVSNLTANLFSLSWLLLRFRARHQREAGKPWHFTFYFLLLRHAVLFYLSSWPHLFCGNAEDSGRKA